MNNRIGCFEAAWLFLWNIIKNSGIYRLLTRIYSGISNAWQKSRIAGWFRVLHTDEDALEKSIAGRIVRCPFTFFEWIQKKAGGALSGVIDKSALMHMCRLYLDNILALNLRFWGILILSSAIGIACGKFVSGNPVGWVIIACGIIGAVISIFNMNITEYLKNSVLIKLVCTLLDIQPEYDWYNRENTIGGLRYFVAAVSGLVFGAVGGIIHPILTAAAIIGAAAVFLVFKKPVFGVFMLVLAAPIAPTMANVGLALLCLISFIAYSVCNKGFKFKFDGIGFFVIIFLCIYAVSAFMSFTPKKSLSICAIYYVFISAYFMIINLIKTKKQLKGLLTAFVISGTLVCLYGIAQYVFGWDTTQAWMDEGMFEDIKMRIYSTLGNPNVLGEYILLVLPAAIGLMWTSKRAAAKIVYAGISAIMFVALILTFSRGCWIGILIAAAIFITFAAGKLWGLGLIALPILPMVIPESIINRFSSIGDMKDSSTSYRVYIWMGTLAMMKDFWLSGIGMGQQAFTAVYPFYSYNAVVAPHSHNLFLQILVECGITGIAAFLIIMILLIRRVMSGYGFGGKGNALSTLMTAITAGICGFLVQGMFDNCFYNYRVMLVFWCVAAMARVCVYLAESDAKGTCDGGAMGGAEV